MDLDFPALMKEKPDDGLRKYIDDYTKYMPEAIEAAISELQRRGQIFSEKELNSFKEIVRAQRKTIEDRENEDLESVKWDENAVSDAIVPELFSQRTIYLASILLGAVTGAILLSVNIKRTKTTVGIIPTICFGLIYSLLQILALTFIEDRRPVMLVSMLGATILNSFFWKKYIGKDTKYRIVPLIK